MEALLIFGAIVLIGIFILALLGGNSQEFKDQEDLLRRKTAEFEESGLSKTEAMSKASDFVRDQNQSNLEQKLLKNAKCPKCDSREYYKQPMSIVRPVGLGSMTEDFYVPFCNTCNVEFVPRVKL